MALPDPELIALLADPESDRDLPFDSRPIPGSSPADLDTYAFTAVLLLDVLRQLDEVLKLSAEVGSVSPPEPPTAGLRRHVGIGYARLFIDSGEVRVGNG